MTSILTNAVRHEVFSYGLNGLNFLNGLNHKQIRGEEFHQIHEQEAISSRCY
jgi:hypothetical protein